MPDGGVTRAASWRRDWALPALLVLTAVVLAGFRVSGSSVGVLEQREYGAQHRDAQLLVNEPRAVRSDEYLVNTALTVAQERAGYPRINPNIGNGQDMSVVLDVPYRDWSTVFKPQHWPFFVLPVETAFAFKWWLLGLLLVSSGYFFVLTLLPGARVVAALTGLALGATPMIQWWYQTITLAPVFYCLFLAGTAVHLHRARSRLSRLLLTALLAYLLTAFALVLYPPFQIPCAWALGAFVVGYCLEHRDELRGRALWRFLLCVTAALALAGALALAFLATRREVVDVVLGTVYPGTRTIASGGFSKAHFLSGYLAGQLADNEAAPHYFVNQSEASSFLMLWPFLFVPSAYLLYSQRRLRTRLSWSLLLVNVVLVAFAARLFLPLPDAVARLLLLDSVLPARLLLGIGLLGMIQIVLLAAALRRRGPRPGRGIVLGAVTLTFGAELYAGLRIRALYPGYAPSLGWIVVLVAAVSLTVWLLLVGRIAAGLLALFALSAAATYRVQPLYVGLDPVLRSDLVRTVAEVDRREPGRWISVNDGRAVNIPAQAGVKTYSAVYAYPPLSLWRELDPTGAESFDYNRYGFAVFSTEPAVDTFTKVSEDAYDIHVDLCGDFAQTQVRYVLSPKRLTSDCTTYVTETPASQQPHFIYRLTPPR